MVAEGLAALLVDTLGLLSSSAEVVSSFLAQVLHFREPRQPGLALSQVFFDRRLGC